jgi:hypothetical protein
LLRTKEECAVMRGGDEQRIPSRTDIPVEGELELEEAETEAG